MKQVDLKSVLFAAIGNFWIKASSFSPAFNGVWMISIDIWIIAISKIHVVD